MRWALYALLTNVEGQFASLRNRVASIDLGNAGRAARMLQAVQADLLTLSRDVVPVASELKEFSERPGWFHSQVYEFRPMGNMRSNEPHLFEGLRQGLARRAVRLQGFEREVKDAATSQGALVATISQSRASDNIVKLTIAIVVLTAVVAGLTGWLAFFD